MPLAHITRATASNAQAASTRATSGSEMDPPPRTPSTGQTRQTATSKIIERAFAEWLARSLWPGTPSRHRHCQAHQAPMHVPHDRRVPGSPYLLLVRLQRARTHSDDTHQLDPPTASPRLLETTRPRPRRPHAPPLPTARYVHPPNSPMPLFCPSPPHFLSALARHPGHPRIRQPPQLERFFTARTPPDHERGCAWFSIAVVHQHILADAARGSHL